MTLVINGSEVLGSHCTEYSVHCTQRTPGFRTIQLLLNRFTHRSLSTLKNSQRFKGTVVNRALPSLHGSSLDITLTVPLGKERKNE